MINKPIFALYPMYLKNLSLLNFRICSEQEFSFSAGVNCFFGNNGSGKTNILDAIHYLSLCKSYINSVDSLQIKQEMDFFMLQGQFDKNDREELITCIVKKNHKKLFKRNKKEYDRLSEHIGLFPVVMISPYDTNLIFEGSEERRKFIDNALSQTDSEYLNLLIRYNHILTNRNAALRQHHLQQILDETLLDIFDEQLAELGEPIFQKRREFIEVFEPLFQKHYSFITENQEKIELVYQSQLTTQKFKEGLAEYRKKDLLLERTCFGIHKDDLEFYLKGMTLKKSGSQGQQKSYLISLKLAHYSYLQKMTGHKPILLLDDIFDKLDDSRVHQLMDMVVREEFGQIFLTDTNPFRIQQIFTKIKYPYFQFVMNNGNLDTLISKT
jgi:DNA replication and repair protein RecF